MSEYTRGLNIEILNELFSETFTEIGKDVYSINESIICSCNRDSIKFHPLEDNIKPSIIEINYKRNREYILGTNDLKFILCELNDYYNNQNNDKRVIRVIFETGYFHDTDLSTPTI